MNTVVEVAAEAGLRELEATLQRELRYLDLPAKAWMPALCKTEKHHDVVIIGGGMAGLTLHAALGFLGVGATIFDASPADLEGPWGTTARMETLRSPKQLTGPALGVPSLTFQAWYIAQFGDSAWQELDKIPRLQWLEYLNWYKRALGIKVRNQHAVTSIDASNADWVALQIQTPQGDTETHYARRVVLATGRDGLGGPSVPAVADQLPRKVWAHSSDNNDYSQLKDKRVGVIGGGASAMDSAATALEAGAQHVSLLIRRPDFPRVNKGKGAGSAGMVHGFSALDDAWRWKIRHYINTQQVPPPRNSVLRVSKHENADFYLGCPFSDMSMRGSEILVTTPKGDFVFDFVIFSTGFQVDWQARPEFANIAPYIRVWGDRYRPSDDEADAELKRLPDLGEHFEFLEKVPGQLPGLANIHCFAYPAVLSHGTVSGDIPAISEGARKLAQGIASQFFVSDIDTHYQTLLAYAEPEVYGDEWVDAGLQKEAQ
ncbi:NAD(P)/FAD-dependent oxidoreductase [Paenalcaligenes niemegkensis]|uniref:SidA/IucD/PvdA family monooxygenase n=1 Tax=Paenalcaligenes niemegkensis TaxID=2895469 RepID=UPI001EE99FE1|nr:NAD(P)/FAD-dependent oxidoreductase [Paenalcaligenes niemegkensis]MCQ9617181.1 NAD(P)/FAD-dependent oxidoreductase [Paenalcaligenes niemegkensis]